MEKSTSLTNTQTYIDVLKAESDNEEDLRGAMALFEPKEPRIKTAIIERGFYNDRKDTSS